MSDNEYNMPVPQGASLADAPTTSDTPSTNPNPGQSPSSDYTTPVPQGASLADPSAAPFNTPSGNTYTPGDKVVHESGATGTVTGQHPDTQQAMVQWNQNHPGQKYGVEGTIRANDPQNAGTAVARWAEQVSNDVKYGTDFTGVGKVLKKLGAHGVDVGNSEAVGDWMASIPLGLLKLTKGMGEAEGSQSAGGNWQAVKDMVGGAGQAATMPTAVIAPESSELEGLAGQAVDKAAEIAGQGASATGKAVKTATQATGKGAKVVAKAPAKLVDKVVDRVLPEAQRMGPENVATAENNFQQTVQPLYDELHEGVRSAVADAAEKAGVQVKPSESIQDVAMDAAKAVRTKASKWYSQIDDAIESATGQPGRFQAHDDNLEALHDKLQDAIGDPEQQAKYAKAIREEEAAKQASLNHVKDAGLEDLPEKATQLHKQARALEDLGKKIQTNTDGLPGDADNPERLNPKTFATSLKNLKNNTRYGGSRLEQAIGPENASTLIQQTSDTRTALKQAEQVEAQRVADRAAQAFEVNSAAKSRDRLRNIVKGAAKTSVYGGIVDRATGGHGGHAVGSVIEGLL